MCGGEFVNALDGGMRRRDERMGEKFDAGDFRLIAWRQRMLQKRGQLRGEGEGAISIEVVEGLFPEAVAGQKETPRAGIVNGKRPHAIEPLEHPLAPFAPTVQEDFGIRVVGGENMSLGEELAAEFRVIVDLSIEDDRNGSVGGHHWLSAAGQIDDREAAVTEKHAGIRLCKKTLGIRPAMGEPTRHALQIRAAARAEKSGYAAHQA